MRKKVILISVLLILLASCFIHVRVDKTVTVKSPFLNVYSFLLQADKWEKWLPGLRQSMVTDSAKISVHKKPNEFTLQYAPIQVAVKAIGNEFNVKEHNDNKTRYYSYVLMPVPDKLNNKTYITAEKKISLLKYCFGLVVGNSFNDTHLDYLKTYMETDSLFYGFNIVKTVVPESDLIVTRKKVLNRDRFTGAAKMLATLQGYVKINGLKQMEPLIAQFIPDAKDSTEVKIGFFVDKAVKPGNGIEYNRMPKGGRLYAARFKGKFCKRGEIYNAMRDYFNDHTIQSLFLPIETYLDNKLPANDNDSVNIQLNFPAFPPANGH